MDSNLINSAERCRLCLDISENFVNIFDTFEESTIAAILTQHFWFQVYKKDGLSEYLCQNCWSNTETFHNFYKKVELLQKSYWESIEIVSAEPDEPIENKSCTDSIKREENVSSPNNVRMECGEDEMKCEQVEQTSELIGIEISRDSDSEYSNDDDDDDEDETKLSDYDDVPSNEDSINDDDTRNAVEKETVSPHTEDKCDTNDDNVDEESSSKSTGPCKKESQAREDAQIREFFSMVCEICSAKFETFVKAKNHYRIVHNTVGYLTCCGKKFLRRGRVLEHINRHLNPDAYRCDPCGRSFADKFALKGHIENHEPFNSRPFKCQLCASSFTKASKLTQHERIRHCPDGEKKFHCDKCNKNFVSKSVLASHIRGVHEFAFAHVCDICARVFKSKYVFQNHMQEHSTTVRPKMQCNVCGAWLKHEDSLRKHLKRHQDTFANCPICNKVLQNKHSLGNHIRSVHGERSHQCTMCDKAFKKAIVLKEHMALHTGQDLYTCHYCTKTFKSGANMHAHRKKAHFAEWTRDRSKRFTPTSVE